MLNTIVTVLTDKLMVSVIVPVESYRYRYRYRYR